MKKSKKKGFRRTWSRLSLGSKVSLLVMVVVVAGLVVGLYLSQTQQIFAPQASRGFDGICNTNCTSDAECAQRAGTSTRDSEYTCVGQDGSGLRPGRPGVCRKKADTTDATCKTLYMRDSGGGRVVPLDPVKPALR